MARPVAVSMPPSTVQPNVWRLWAPAPEANTKGRMPKMNASEVMMMGRKRRRTASSVACTSGIPRSTRSLANSMMRMAFFADKPIRVIMPIWAYTLFVSLGRKNSARMAPKIPTGTASSTENGIDQLS